VQGGRDTGICFLVLLRSRLILPQTIWLNWGLTDEDMATLPAAVQRGFMSDTLQGTANARRLGWASDQASDKAKDAASLLGHGTQTYPHLSKPMSNLPTSIVPRTI
jgi:hypothetical protein